MYYIYIHTVPNGKIYIGQTKNINNRWRNGEGYVDNRPFYKDIKIYGWKNIKHEIIAECEELEAALKLESVLIAVLKAENPDYGYNQTNIYENAMKLYIARVPDETISLEKPISEDSFFETSGLPRKACEDMIEQWIFNEKHRDIMKRRLLDGLTYSELSAQFNMSIRQMKNIVYNGCAKLERRF